MKKTHGHGNGSRLCQHTGEALVHMLDEKGIWLEAGRTITHKIHPLGSGSSS